MNTSAADIQEARARDVRVGEDSLVVELMDGRTLTVPLVWYPRLWYGSAAERAHFELISDGQYSFSNEARRLIDAGRASRRCTRPHRASRSQSDEVSLRISGEAFL